VSWSTSYRRAPARAQRLLDGPGGDREPGDVIKLELVGHRRERTRRWRGQQTRLDSVAR